MTDDAPPGPTGPRPDPADLDAPHGAREPWPANLARGGAMGLADVVPGVSGGTIALVLGIHPRLVTAIAAFDRAFLRALAGVRRPAGLRGLRERLRAMDTPFLLLLVAGIGAGVLLGSWILTGLMERHPVPLAAFFFGLIVASVRVPWRMMPRHGPVEAAAFLAAGALAFWITVLEPLHAPAALWFLPVAGAVAICAMILPGVSGAFLLLLMGLYEPLLHAVKSLDLVRIGLFGGGALVGILAFSHVLRRLLDAAPGPTLAALAGLMVGSLGRVWPFKTGGEHFGEGTNVAPPGGEAALLALAAAVLGGLVILLLERAGARRPTTKPS